MWLPLAPRMLWVARCHESGGVFVGSSRCSAALGLRALGRFVDAGWQDSRAVHDSRGPRSEKRPFLARSSRGVSSDGDLRGISDAWRAYPARASPFSDAWRANLAANWRFSRPRPLSGCVGRKNCHGLPPGDAGQERIRAQSCHRRTLGNASREHFAIVERLGTHQGIILPRPDARAERPARPCATAPARPTPVAPNTPPFVYATRHPDAAELRVLQAVRALAVAQPADCRVAAERVVNIAKLVSVPQRPALQHHDAMHRTRRFCRR